MSSTYSQVYLQLVFAVRYRQSLIHASWENELYKYLTGAFQAIGHKVIAINGMPDHLHILIGMKLSCNISDNIREIKKASTHWINTRKFTPYHFQWQDGFGAFSYSHSSLCNVAHYINQQKEHHSTTSFRKEYTSMLREFHIEYNEKYVFTEPIE